MIIVSVLRQTGVFEYVAIWSAKRARGSPLRVMILLVLVTAIASALLDNVTTVLLVAPVTLLVCDRLAINAAPFLMAEAFASNIGGTATLVGDPPNIIIASEAGLTFNDFLIHLAPIVIIVIAVLIALLPRLFPGAFTVDPERVADVMSLEETRGHPRSPAAHHVRRRLGGGVHRVHRPRGAAHGALGRGAVGRRHPDRGVQAGAVRLPVQRRVGHAAVLRRPVRHGRGAGEDRRRQTACAVGDRRHRRQHLARRRW